MKGIETGKEEGVMGNVGEWEKEWKLVRSGVNFGSGGITECGVQRRKNEVCR